MLQLESFRLLQRSGDDGDEHAGELSPDTGDVHRPHQSGADLESL
jgi:hypothetical protein